MNTARQNGSHSYQFDFVSDGLIIDKLIGTDGRKVWSIEDFPPEFREKFLDSGKQIVSYIRKSWFKTGVQREADIVGDCLNNLLHWASIAFFAGIQIGVVAEKTEPERYKLKPELA